MNVKDFSSMFDLVESTVLSVKTINKAVIFEIETVFENEYHANGYRPTLNIDSVHTYTFTHQPYTYDIDIPFSITSMMFKDNHLYLNDIVLDNTDESEVKIK